MMAESIFIQIASYRDPQLIFTVKDAIAQADDPSRLHFCIAWQHGEEQTERIFSAISPKPKLTVLDIPYNESKGACWARNQIQGQYQGEDYTLQLDSHHRFRRAWDSSCVRTIKNLRDRGVKKPLLTAYIPSFDPDRGPRGRINKPWLMKFERFIPEGAILFKPDIMPDWQDRTLPMRARFYSAHFAFTVGQFCEEVPHDPKLYFHGEEINITVRAFTHGYDLFHPHEIIAWHEYMRKERRKHWQDHGGWRAVNHNSHTNIRRLFGMDEYMEHEEAVAEIRDGPFGFGEDRTLEQYERYAGICFKKRAVTKAVLDCQEPSPEDNRNLSYDDFASGCVPVFKHCIDIGLGSVPLDDYDFWCVSFQDRLGNEIYRQDAYKSEIDSLKRDPDGYFKLWRQFVTETRPAIWMVWPHSETHGWCKPVIGKLQS